MELHKELQIPKAVDMFSIWMHKIVFLLPSLRVCIVSLSLTIQNPSDTRHGHWLILWFVKWGAIDSRILDITTLHFRWNSIVVAIGRKTLSLERQHMCHTVIFACKAFFSLVVCCFSAVLCPSLLCLCSADIISLPCAVLLKVFTQANGLVFFSITCSEVAGTVEAIHSGARWHYCSHVICYYATWPEHTVFHEMYFLFFNFSLPQVVVDDV